MAEALVPSLLKLITDVLEPLIEEWKLGSKAKTELEYLKDLIGNIGLSLKTINSKEIIDQHIKEHRKRMRRFLYDAQDAIDDFMERGKCKLGLRAVSKHMKRRTLASEAERIRQAMDNYEKTLKILNGISPHHAESSSACHQSLSIAFSDERDDDLVGIETATEELVRWLTADSPPQKVIFVHGAQGVGKTSVVGAVLRHDIARRHFNYYVWINLRTSELVDNKVTELMDANAVTWNPTEENSQGSQRQLREVFQFFGQKTVRWVLVLDDAGSTRVFESLHIHLAQTRPTMLVTTRDSSLASNSKTFLHFQSAPRYEIRHFRHVLLSLDDSLNLLCQKIFRIDACPNYLKDASKDIVKRCGGLPLAILAVSNLLSDEDGVNGKPRSVVWTELSSRLGEELLSKWEKSGLIRRMITLRMDHLHDVWSCLFYLSIFPLDRPISCSRLMRLWMAERFIEPKGTIPIQNIAEDALIKLVNHNLFQEVKETNYRRAKTCLIHNILHQIIISKSKDDEFAMIFAGLGKEWPEIMWRLSIHSQMASIEARMKVKRLRSLLVFNKVHPDSMKALLKQVNRLKVLDIQDCSLEKFPKKILRLKYLRYLRLRDTSVTEIPDGIGNLAHLETLDLKDTSVTELPANIWKLKALRHLLVYRSDPDPAPGNYPKYGGVKAPSQLGDLTSLQKLCLIDLDEVKQSKKSDSDHGKRLLEELGKLENLRRLGISNLRQDHVQHLCSSIEKFKKLETLHLIATRDRGALDLSEVDETKVSQFLQRVHLTGYMVTLPKWILSHSLAKLFLRGSGLTEEDPLRHFKGLPSLKHLELQEAFIFVHKMKFEEGGFQQLRFLGLDTFPFLMSMTVEKKALPALERLSLARCEKLTTVPRGITDLEQLKCLEYYKMPEAFKTAIRGDKAVQAHDITLQEKDWKPGAVEEGNGTESSRPLRVNNK